VLSEWTLEEEKQRQDELWIPPARPGFGAIVWWSLRYSRRQPYRALRLTTGYLLLGLAAAAVALGIVQLLT
jgi:hypothetical protein